MLKSLMEYKKINAILAKSKTEPALKIILQLIPRIAYFFYWFLDTILVLTKIKVLTRTDIKSITYRWGLLWTTANLFTILGAIVELVSLAKKEAKLTA